MKIVLVGPFGLRPKMTTRVRALRLGQALVERGHAVTLLVPPWDDRGSAGQATERHGVRLRHALLPPFAALDGPWLTAWLLEAARRERPDILHCFKPKALTGFVQLGWQGARRIAPTLAPLVMDSDDWEGWGGWNESAPYSRVQKELFARQEAWGLRSAAAVTVASRELEQRVRAMGRSEATLAYLPNGPGDPWPPADAGAVAARRAALGLQDHPTALLFTRFFEFDEQRLARRWACVAQALPSARLLVVGAGLHGEERRFRAALDGAGVGQSVVMVGWQPFAALPTHFALAHAALYPMDDTLLNRAKCPVKLADMLQAALPVVGEGVGQVADYLGEGAGGLLVAPGDDAGFVAATLRLLREPALGAALGRAGQQRLATHFAWPVAAARAEALYQRLRHDATA